MLSKQFKDDNSECSKNPKDFHFQRIFRVYREVFGNVLGEHRSDEDFIFIEDDAKLINFYHLHSEICSARKNNLLFYSLYQTANQVGTANVLWNIIVR